MRKSKILSFALATVLITGTLATHIAKAYIPTSRDTNVAPPRAEYEIEKTDGFTLLYETSKVKYYWREDRDVIAVEDKATGYIMKTGGDFPFPSQIKAEVKKLISNNTPLEELIKKAESYPDDLNATYVGIANSLVTAEYYSADKIKYISSASEKNAESKLTKLSDSEYKLAVNFTELDIKLNIYITFGEASISYHVPAGEMEGQGLSSLASLDITPFLGASGGISNVFNPETMEYETKENYRVPGYVLVPDGSGTLIRFQHNNAVYNQYIGDVYGKDYSTETYYNTSLRDDVPAKNPVMPVYGMAHGDGQMAFVAWADKGAEYMDIIVNHDGAKSTNYTWAYPRFEYNINYYQIFDEKGNGFYSQMDKPFSFDVDMTYAFLFGDGTDGTYKADYTGMALTYRKHLLDSGIINLMTTDNKNDIPLRLDFIMGDSEKGLFGTNQVVTTTTADVEKILKDVLSTGIKNVNSGLYGWQSKGETLRTPAEFKFTKSIGSKKDFQKLITEMEKNGVDVSFARDNISINKKMVNYFYTGVKAISNWYVSIDKSWVLSENAIIKTFSFATPQKVASWTKTLAKNAGAFSTSLTLSGGTNILLSNWNRDGMVTSLTETIELYEKTYADINKDMLLNLDNPNMYLWKYTDRYLNVPVGGSQYIYENDSVPFLQMVLYGTMEMYAPYSNFSFYTQDCILRMIDYGISPSFILSEEPSYLLSDTFSFDLYSTEYNLYKDMIQNIYGQVNGVLSEVYDMEWIGREVPEAGVVINTYTSGSTTKYVVINYTEKAVIYKGIPVPAESAAVAK